MSARAIRVAALLCAAVTALGAAADALYVIDLRHRPAAEVQPLIQPLLRPDEGLSGSGFQLYLRASPARHREIELLVAQLDVAARQLTVTVRQTTARREQHARDAVSGEIDVGSGGRIVVPDRPAGGGAVGDDSLRYRFERRDAASAQDRVQVLRVQEGNAAYIRVGQSVPVVERVLALSGRRATVLASGVRFEDFTTGFEVRPRVRGDTVYLEITPRLAVPGRRDGTFQFQELSTTVAARLGEWIDLGSLSGHSTEAHRAILRSAQVSAGEHATILLKVEAR